mmetsp:Transcript_2625/g.7589  ORF Transcript_2625/g.7589 Transcript_2625/m.7589 type:complete len:282 (+) Transcript_2625:246-1091(+)
MTLWKRAILSCASAHFFRAKSSAEFSFAVRSIVSAPASSRMETQSSHPCKAAYINGVTPASVAASTEAPAAIRALMSAARPHFAAQCNERIVVLSAFSKLAPSLIALSNASWSPLSAAQIRSSSGVALLLSSTSQFTCSSAAVALPEGDADTGAPHGKAALVALVCVVPSVWAPNAGEGVLPKTNDCAARAHDEAASSWCEADFFATLLAVAALNRESVGGLRKSDGDAVLAHGEAVSLAQVLLMPAAGASKADECALPKSNPDAGEAHEKAVFALAAAVP